MTAFLLNGDYRLLALIAHGHLELRDGGWRFGTKRIADHVVDRLINSGRAVRDGNAVRLVAEIQK